MIISEKPTKITSSFDVAGSAYAVRNLQGFFNLKERGGKMKENLNNVQNDLYHIHSLANLLVGKYQEMVDVKQIIENLDEASSPLLSIAEMIMEKSKACLEAVDKIDGKFQEMGI